MFFGKDWLNVNTKMIIEGHHSSSESVLEGVCRFFVNDWCEMTVFSAAADATNM